MCDVANNGARQHDGGGGANALHEARAQHELDTIGCSRNDAADCEYEQSCIQDRHPAQSVRKQPGGYLTAGHAEHEHTNDLLAT